MEWGLRVKRRAPSRGRTQCCQILFCFCVGCCFVFGLLVGFCLLVLYFLLCFDGGTHATRVRIVELLGAVDVSTGPKYSCVPRGTAAGAV